MIGVGVDLQAEDLAVGVGRQFGMGDVVAAMRVGEEAFGAVGRPLHRAAAICFAAQTQTTSSA